MYSPPGLPPRLAKFTTYSTDIFDVLQTSRGLPRLDLFAEDTDSDDPSSVSSTPLPETVPVKLSLSQDNSAAPKDDPRFVIWGEVGRMWPGEVYGFGDGGSSVSHETSSSAQSSTKGKARASDIPFNGSRGMDLSSNSSEDGSRARVLLAATIERWLAQLTSDLDYDELLNFFLTYRTYISALDLARLLMARFCWALGTRSPASSATLSTTGSAEHEGSTDADSDDIVRRIVRVRTFVAFKYWLITFFTVDFVPNRELRLFVASHLNELGEELRELQKDVCKCAGDLGKEQTEREMGMSRGAIIDGVSIVKKLKKVAKDCKQLYTHNNVTTPAISQAQSAPSQSQPQSSRKSVSLSRGDENGADNRKEHLFGAKFAEATRKLSAASATNPTDTDDSDVDLDFLSDEPVPSMVTPFSGAPVNNVNLGGASTLNLSPTLSPPGPGSIPLSSFSILQRTDHAPGPEGFTHIGSSMSSGIYSANTNGPIPHNALSRVLVKTLGRLGRWKRVLNSGGVAHGANMHRSMATSGLGKSHPGIGFTRMAAACADVSAFDVELTLDSSDLLSSSEGVESYLRLVETQKTSLKKHVQEPPASTIKPPKVHTSLSVSNPTPLPSAPPAAASSSASPMAIAPAEEKISPRQSVAIPLGQTINLDPSESPVQAALPEDDQSFSDRSAVLQHRHSTADTVSDYGIVTNVYEAQDSVWSVNEGPLDTASSRESRATLATRRTSGTSSTDSFGEPISANRASARFPAFTSPWQFDVVSLDELSDNSSDERTGNAVTTPTMPPGLRRPPRRLPLRREFEFLERPETVSSMGIISRSSIVSASSASGQSTVSRASTSSAIGGLGGGIQQWQMNALKDSLTDDEEPGDVDEALKRLEGQINPQKQLEKVSKVNGWVQTIRQRLAAGDYSDEEPMYSDDDEADIEDEDHASVDSASSPSSQNADPSTTLSDVEAEAPVVTRTDQVASPARSTDAKPALEDVVPLEILQSRVSSEQPSTTPERVSVTSKFVDPGPKAHRSFVLMFKAEDLAQHFAMIDRELFMTIKFEELLLDDWMYCEEVDALEWAQFLKDRARWKAESRWPEKTSALGAVRARFNLMVNFTISEIVLTNQAERPYVFSKFLRIAWKSYQRSSFNTLVAIMTGLQSDWVKKAMRKSMHRLAVWDNRLLNDFKVFTSSEDNFRHIRSAIDAINDAKPLETTSRAPSVANSGGNATDKTTAPTACVPFIGAYLSQLYQYNQLPVLIDPTAPNEVVTFDPVSSNLSSPAHPEVFSTLAPLPSSMNLEPLINVHRQRLIAGVIKSLVAGQHLASRIQFPIDKKLFHKCLRIRGLDSNTLQRALVMLPH
ncbi:ras guanine nucleotide exchange factor domain-containing protein [Rhodocollybia butyracea]|uniref:Ras guanine nucleotide exchange factor domain-containing protein n=1 Tax=Rhodocollybia butyracea TaxID=206335 RepID=A0A9P5Q3I2_9AGAR|nr:ras guanine nucleotide exchange factor domain-containing protein [Rhodocollybia butyracea]